MWAAMAVIVGLVVVDARPRAMADELYGRVSGVVTDDSGAVLPGGGCGSSQTLEWALTKCYIECGWQFESLTKAGTYSLTSPSRVSRLSMFQRFRSSRIRFRSERGHGTWNFNEISGRRIRPKLNNPDAADHTISQQKYITDLTLTGRNWIVLHDATRSSNPRQTISTATFRLQMKQGSPKQLPLVTGKDFNDLPLYSPLAPPNTDTIEDVKMVTNRSNPELADYGGYP